MIKWISVDAPIAPPEGENLLLFNRDWIDDDFNPSGVREGFMGPENWFSACWFDYQDCYETDMHGPTHWRPLPEPPEEEDEP